MELRAISLWPEWVYAIANLNKRVENRSWTAPRKMVGTKIGIHAGKSFGGINKRPARMYFEPVVELGLKAGYKFKDIYSSTGPRSCWVGFRVFRPDGSEGFPMDARILPRGALIATAVLVSSSFLYAGRSSYEDGTLVTAWSAEGNYGWQLEDVRLLEDPIFMRGNQGIWKVKPEYFDEIERQTRQSLSE